MINPFNSRFLAIAALAFAATAGAAESAKDAAVAAKANATNPADIQALLKQFNAKRDSMLADRQALLDQLKGATAEQRKQILEKMKAQQKDLIEAQRAIGRQLRDEMRKLQQPAAPGGRR
jgi:flagellar motility protein MotE (MotC chaperone)